MGRRASAWTGLVAVAMVGGCYIDDDAYGCFDPEPLPAGECWVDTDCPRVECHRAPSCVAGQCLVLAQPKPTLCSFGVCTEDSVCVACVADADCEAVNDADCYSLECLDSGKCYGKVRPVGERCTHGNGTCDISAACVP